jgi:hypothetical protein
MGRPRKHPRRWFKATQSFGGTYPDTNEPYSFIKGEIVPEQIVQRLSRMYFEPLDDDFPVEQATAAPGEKRER